LKLGVAGVGKDTVAVEVVNQAEVRAVGGIQAWLQASSDVMLRQQLVDLFLLHRPEVVDGLEQDIPQCLVKIKQWLVSAADWLLVFEDAHENSTTIWELLEGNDSGRVLITSQAPLHIAQPAFAKNQTELLELTTSDSMNLLLKFNIFSSKKDVETRSHAGFDLAECPEVLCEDSEDKRSEDVRRLRRELADGIVKILRRTDEAVMMSEEDLRSTGYEHKCWVESARSNTRDFDIEHVNAVDLKHKGGLKKKAKAIQRDVDSLRKALCLERRKMAELTHPEFGFFLESELGNLPLSVAMVGHMIRSDPTITCSQDVIGLFKKKMKVADLDRSGRNPMTDRHLFGLSKSVAISVDRLANNSQLPETHRSEAKALLIAMSMLDRTQTPLALLQNVVKDPLRDGVDADLLPPEPELSVFRSEVALKRARDILFQIGLLKWSAERDVYVGAMHQLVQKCVLQNLTDGPEVVTIMGALRKLIHHKFYFDPFGSPSETWNVLRTNLPSVEAWCDTIVFQSGDNDANKTLSPLKAVEGDLRLLLHMGSVVMELKQDYASAMIIFEKARTWAVEMNVGAKYFARAMNGMAHVCSNLGQHQAAAKIHEMVIPLLKKILWFNHPSIGKCMGHLASSYSHLERNEEALAIREDVLQFAKKSHYDLYRYRDKLPQQCFPDVGYAMANLGSSYSKVNRHDDALAMQTEALEHMKQSTLEGLLPKDHPSIATIMENIGNCHFRLRNYPEALAVRAEVLEIRMRVLSEDHLDIADAMDHLGKSIMRTDRCEDAIVLFEEALSIRKKRLPGGHPLVEESKNVLSTAKLAIAEPGNEVEQASSCKVDPQILQKIPEITENAPEMVVTAEELKPSHGSPPSPPVLLLCYNPSKVDAESTSEHPGVKLTFSEQQSEVEHSSSGADPPNCSPSSPVPNLRPNSNLSKYDVESARVLSIAEAAIASHEEDVPSVSSISWTGLGS
jgi:tetratricopeptide (TPR) repeat protein